MVTQLSKPVIIISAVNLIEGGPLSILKDCLAYVVSHLIDRYKVIALVHSKALFDLPEICFIEIPKAKRSWLNRLYYEFFHFSHLSRQLKPYLWLSLHDITPNVEANILAVYCHNSSPFYELSLKDAMIDQKFVLFNLFYKYLYMINIKKNDFVIVQQNWIREEFKKLYGINNIVVAYPDINTIHPIISNKGKQGEIFSFFYPAFPRFFKNYEVICEAVKKLNTDAINNFQVFLTINGTENRYSKYIYNKYKDIKSLRFIGLQSRDMIYEYYSKVDCLIFPSKLETWGIPITEFKDFNKPILLADEKYAHETIGEYDKVIFFNPDNHKSLSEIMKKLMNGSAVYEHSKKMNIEQPFASNWKELFDILLK